MLQNILTKEQQACLSSSDSNKRVQAMPSVRPNFGHVKVDVDIYTSYTTGKCSCNKRKISLSFYKKRLQLSVSSAQDSYSSYNKNKAPAA